jgi:hypothetical protein
MKTLTEIIILTLKGEQSDATIYWDTQDQSNIGPAFRMEGDSGALNVTGWAHVSGRALANDEAIGYNVSDYFTAGAYRGPDANGIYPMMELA